MRSEVITGDSMIEVPKLINEGLEMKRVAIITDNPYGMNNDADYTRFSGGLAPQRNKFENIAGDDKPFDPSYWLQFPFVTLWGYNHIARTLPLGTVLVWSKKRENQLGSFLSDCELGYEKGGCGIYQFSHIWNGFDRESEKGQILHPNQKPVALMKWCIERQELPISTIIVDPFCGVGTTGIAATLLGFDFIGIEISEHYAEIARARISRAQGQWAEIPKSIKDVHHPLFETR
jgi:site-specific DNA-methyltransferase (adenine-specific)